MMPDTPQLNYAPRPPMHRRRVFRWWLYAVMLLGIAGSGYWWVPPAWRRVQVLYWQHQCLIFSPPADQIVCNANIHVVPTEWSKFYSMVSPPGSTSYATLFMHEMKNPKGESRLVVVDLQKSLFDPPAVYKNFTRVFMPGNLFRSPVELNVNQYSDGNVSIQMGVEVAHAGAIDPRDPTHFTLQCIDDKNNEIFYDGWLQNDDKLSFGPRRASTK